MKKKSESAPSPTAVWGTVLASTRLTILTVCIVGMRTVCPILCLANQADSAEVRTGADDPPSIVHVDQGLISLPAGWRLVPFGIELEPGKTVRWESIASGSVGSEQQVQFDNSVRLIGLPLRQLLSALRRGNWESASAGARQLQLTGLVDSQAIEIPCLTARYRQALASDHPEWAVQPFLQIVVHPCREEAASMADWRSVLPLAAIERQLPPELLPVWGGGQTAGEAWQALRPWLQTILAEGHQDSTLYVCGISLAVGAGELDAARQMLAQWDAMRTNAPEDLPTSGWFPISDALIKLNAGELVAAESILMKEQQEPGHGPTEMATIDYGLAVARFRQSLELAPHDSLLELLAFVARHQEGSPQAARQMLEVAEALAVTKGWPREASAIAAKLELLRKRIARYNSASELRRWP